MLARKISASSGVSLARNGRRPAGDLRAEVMTGPPRCPLVGQGIATARSLLLLPACGEKVGMRGRGRESERVEMSHHLGKSEPVEAPPHPNPLPASGEREPRGVRGTFVPDPSSRDLPGRAILGVLKRDAHGC